MAEIKRNPDALLKHVEQLEQQAGKGKLKIFFGYAAGVGKTYAMLQSAHEAQKAGIDVVIGYIEPHTRPETMALTQGLELLPTLPIQHKNITLHEFDLDGALKRKPKIALVDELAHTNAPTCRHLKRYQDIKELLNAGIDVYTTVNVQHLESLNDMIAGITKIAVRERIPDTLFDEADQVELVDVEPVELLQRLRSGKIYRSQQASKAMENFFSIDNLISLREIALRRMADRVNMIQEKNLWVNAEVEGISVEHILICLSTSPTNEKVIRQGARMAKAFRGKFTAFYVETAHFSDLSKEKKDVLYKNMHLAEQLGAKVVTSYGNDVVEQIAEYAKVARVSKIVLGRTNTRRNLFSVRESFSARLTNMAPNLEIFLIPNSYNDEPDKHRKLRMYTKGLGWDVFATVSVLLFATLLSTKIRHFSFSETSIPMLYLLGVLFVSLATQRKVMSILYSLGSIFIYNYFFVAPYNTLFVYHSEQFVTFFIMFVTAFISSSLTQKVKDAARSNAKKSYRTELLLETSLKLQNSNTANDIATHITEQLGKLLEKNVCFFLGNPVLNPTPIASYMRKGSEGGMQLNPQEIGVAEWTFKNNKHAGFSTTTLPGARCLYLAIRNGVKVFAVIGIDMERKEIPAFEKDVMGAILNECALALEKNELIQQQQHTHLKLEQEQLRANLLRSISHDLRTPLTSISGNASILMDQESKIEERQKQKLYLDIYDDSMWLINLVENLLSVTRIENGTMSLNMQPELVSDVIAEAMKHLNRRNVDHHLTIVEEDDLLVANMDAKLIMQVLINLVDNAIKYTDVGSHITISTWKQLGDVYIEVQDDGWGIPDEQKAKLFEMFYTVDNQVADGRRGMGLGLALCKSIVEAHGGELSVHDNVPTGTIFRFCLKAQEVYLHEE